MWAYIKPRMSIIRVLFGHDQIQVIIVGLLICFILSVMNFIFDMAIGINVQLCLMYYAVSHLFHVQNL